MTVSADQLQAELPRLLSRVQAGETLEIELSGELVGRLVPAHTGKRLLSILEGKGVIPDDIKTPYREETGCLVELPRTEATVKQQRERMFGLLAGTMRIPDDFDEMMRDEIEEMFYGTP